MPRGMNRDSARSYSDWKKGKWRRDLKGTSDFLNSLYKKSRKRVELLLAMLLLAMLGLWNMPMIVALHDMASVLD